MFFGSSAKGILWSAGMRDSFRITRRMAREREKVARAKQPELQRLADGLAQLLAQKLPPPPPAPPPPPRPITKAHAILAWLILGVLPAPWTNGWSILAGLILAGLTIRGARLQGHSSDSTKLLDGRSSDAVPTAAPRNRRPAMR
jgi:hypothetical protein